MKAIGTLRSCSVEVHTGKPILTIELDDDSTLPIISDMLGDKVNMELKRRKSRSLDANAYCWVLNRQTLRKAPYSQNTGV